LNLLATVEELSRRLEGRRGERGEVSVGLLANDIDTHLYLLGDELAEAGAVPGSACDASSRHPAASNARQQAKRLEEDRSLIGLTEASELFDIPKSGLSKAAGKAVGVPGHLRCERAGRRVFFYREDISNLARSRCKLKPRPEPERGPQADSSFLDVLRPR
jgi:hypothetical protein